MAKASERRILRKVVRVGFAQYRVVLLFIAIGVIISLLPVLFQQRTYRGTVELAVANDTERSPSRLPDVLKLRRLAAAPQHVAVLAGLKPGEASHDAVSGIVKTIELTVNRVDQIRSYVVLAMDVPAASWSEAEKKIQNYVEAMQEDFQSNSDPSLAIKPGSAPATKWQFEIRPAKESLAFDGSKAKEPGKFAVRQSAANSPATLKRKKADPAREDGEIVAASFQTKDETPPKTLKQPAAKPVSLEPPQMTPADVELRENRSALAQLDNDEAKLVEGAKALKTSLAGLNVALEEVRRGWDERARQMEKLESSITSRLQLLNEIETRGTSSPPAEIEARFPTIAELRKQLDALQKNQIELAKVLKPTHPDWKAASKELDDTRAKLSSELAGIIRNERRTIQRLEENQRTLEKAREKDKTTIESLVSLVTQRDEISRKKQNLRDRISRLQLDLMTQQQAPKAAPVIRDRELPPVATEQKIPPVENSKETAKKPDRPQIGPMVRDVKLPAGKLLVAGPFVEKNPVQPRITYNVLMGCLAGLFLGAIVVFVRGGSDQRVYSPQDFDDTEVNVKVLGSIPELKSSSPIRWTGKVNGGSAH